MHYSFQEYRLKDGKSGLKIPRQIHSRHFLRRRSAGQILSIRCNEWLPWHAHRTVLISIKWRSQVRHPPSGQFRHRVHRKARGRGRWPGLKCGWCLSCGRRMYLKTAQYSAHLRCRQTLPQKFQAPNARKPGCEVLPDPSMSEGRLFLRRRFYHRCLDR